MARQLDVNITTIKSDVFKYLEKSAAKADIIFADPPYDFSIEDFSKVPELVFANKLLEDDGLLIVEHSKYTDLSSIEHYAYSKSYGGNVFSFFETHNKH